MKTDRLDARYLDRLHPAGELTAIRVPTPQEEALRDLVWVREDPKGDRRETQQRLKAFLLRQGRRHPGKGRGWTAKFDLRVHTRHFDEPTSETAIRHYLAASTPAGRSSRPSTRSPCGRPPASPRRLGGQAAVLPGINTLSAVTIAAKLCDFRRFPSAPSSMAFTGLVSPTTRAAAWSDGLHH